MQAAPKPSGNVVDPALGLLSYSSAHCQPQPVGTLRSQLSELLALPPLASSQNIPESSSSLLCSISQVRHLAIGGTVFPLKEKPNSIFDVFKGGPGRHGKTKQEQYLFSPPVCAEGKMPGWEYSYICIGMSRRARVTIKTLHINTYIHGY